MSGSNDSSKWRLPVEGSAGARQLVVAVAHAGDTERDVGRMGCDLVSDAALLDVVRLGRPRCSLGVT